MKIFLFIIINTIFLTPLQEAQGKEKLSIVGIHSYSYDFPWTNKLIDSFRKTMSGIRLDEFEKPSKKSDFILRNFFLNIKKRPISKFGKPNKVISEIKAWIVKNKPQAIYITDDFALSELAPWLSKQKTPIVFAGINGLIPKSLDKKGLRVSGVYERYYLKESIRLLRQILGKKSLKIGLLLEDSPTGKIVEGLVTKVLDQESGIIAKIFICNKYGDWMKTIKRKEFDAFFPLQPYAIRKGSDNHPAAKMIEDIVNHSVRPTVFTASWHIKCGGSFAVTQWPSAQGYHAAEQLKKLIQNKQTSIVTPKYGNIEINYEATKKLNVKIPYELLASSKIHRSIQKPCVP